MNKVLAVLFLFLECLNVNLAFAAPNQTIVLENKVQISIGDDSQITIKHTNYKIKEIFSLSAPNRLVVDINNFRFRKNYNQTPHDTKIINRVRTGNHPNLARIVFDIGSTKIPSYTSSDVDGILNGYTYRNCNSY